MERLTAKHPKGGYFVLCGACPRRNKEECGLDDCVYVLTRRLAAYEDTGLTMEEINKLDTQRKAMAALADSYKAEISDLSVLNKPAIMNALRKQIPQKPIRDSLADRACPVCDAYIPFDALNDRIEDAPKFCKECGQALDWSDVE